MSLPCLLLSVQRGIALSAAVSRQLEIYKSSDAREAVRDIRDGNTVLVGGIELIITLHIYRHTDSTAVGMMKGYLHV